MSSFSFQNVVFYTQVLVNLVCVRNFGKDASSNIFGTELAYSP